MTSLVRSRLLNAILLTAVGAVFLAGCGGAGDDKPDASTHSDSATAPPSSPESNSGYGYKLDRGTASALVERSMFGADWPLTVESGIVNCSKEANGSVAVIFQTDDVLKGYAVNGYAKGSKTMEFYDLQPIDPIWADDPSTGYKKDIGVLIDICKPYME